MMKQRFLIFLILAHWIPLEADAVMPGGLQWNYFGPRQMSMGFTGVAAWDNPSAAAFNPGSMCFHRKSSLQAGSTLIQTSTSFREASPSIYSDSTVTPLLSPVYFNAVIRLTPHREKRSLSLGLALNQPFGTSIAWPDNWKGKFISQEFALNTYFLHLSASFKLNSHLGFGVGGSFGAVNLLSRRALSDAGGFNLDFGSVALGGTDLTSGLFAGIFFQPKDQLSFSAVVRSPMKVDIENGLADFSVPASLENIYPDGSFQLSFWLPGRIDLGMRYQPEPRLTITAELNLAGWSILDSMKYVLEETIGEFPQYPEKRFQSSSSMRCGAEYAANERWSLRTGLYLENSPVPQELLSPEFPDATRLGLTTGLGCAIISRLHLDIAYQFAFSGERSAILEPARFGGTYESVIHGFCLGLTYQW